MGSGVRIDKWLWSVRIYKTRSDAAEACKMNRVLVGGAYCKPSYEIKIGDMLTVRKGAVTYTYRVLEFVSTRQGAAKVAQYVENLTPQSELDKLHPPHQTVFVMRDRGTGRPTKKERREIDALMDDLSYVADDDI